jgi:ABC-type multidrug transport system ATPase subunit
VRCAIGFVGHELGLYRELTAAENLAFTARMYGIDRPTKKANELLTDAGLVWVADRAVGKLSQGICRRIAIARCLVHEPQIILLDEPFASLDTEGRQWLHRLFAQWREVGRTVCFVSHDQHQSRELADLIISLQRGRLAEHESDVTNSALALRSA